MHKPRLRISTTVKCIDCGFFGYREGGVSVEGETYLGDKFWECHDNLRKKQRIGDSYISFSEDGNNWNVIGCFHRVWSLWGSNSKAEKEKAKEILTEGRHCKYYFPYESGYEPAGHNEMRRDKRNQRIILLVGLINAAAIVLAALITGILRG
jgi:hypothetical protein